MACDVILLTEASSPGSRAWQPNRQSGTGTGGDERPTDMLRSIDGVVRTMALDARYDRLGMNP